MATRHLTADAARQTWLGVDDVPLLAAGCAVLGTGGGGHVETGILTATRALLDHGPVRLVRLAELDPDALVVPLSGIGAPTVGHEMLPSADEPLLIRDEIKRLMGRAIDAVMASEIGGSNGVAPLGWAARLGVPLVDADGMGRAFPEVQMVSWNVAGLPTGLVVLADVVGNVATLRPVDGMWSEWHARALCVSSGASALMADYVLTAGQARGAVIEGTVTTALAIGGVLAADGDPVAALRAELGAAALLTGKIADVERRTGGGFVRGSVVIDGTGADRGRTVRVELQNENLVVLEDGVVLATVPDLISIVDSVTGQAISTEALRYGQRICLLAWPCDPLWRTPRGLEIAGPRAFGYDLDFVPVEEAARDHR